MHKRLRKPIIAALCAVAWLIPMVSAQSVRFVPYDGYDYNAFGESVPAPVGYEPARTLTGAEIGLGPFSAPQDFCFTRSGELYILDSGNSHILVTDPELNVKRTISSFQNGEEELAFTGAKGLFVCGDGTILVADTENLRVIEAAPDGTVQKILTMPESELIGGDRLFQASKVIRDTNENTFVIVKEINEGAVTFRPDRSFGGFFATNEVQKTAEMLKDFVWSMFQTDAQKRASKSRTPSEFTNFDIDADNFLYTVTATAKSAGHIPENNVRKLNFKGANILEYTSYGDYEWDREQKETLSVVTRMVDIDIDGEGYMVMLDEARGRVFEYTPDGGMITVSGALGDQVGTFKKPVAVETYGGRIYVLDELLNSITIFEPTAYTLAFKEAVSLFEAGKYSESKEYWETVLSYNSNNLWAYYGIGQALTEAGYYAESLEYFKLSYSARGYSDSFAEVRTDFIRSHFMPLLLGLVACTALLALGIRALSKRIRRKNAYARSVLETTYTYPLFTMIHPYSGFDQLKTGKKWSMRTVFGILMLLFFTLLARWFLTGFPFMEWRVSDFNILITLTQAFAVAGVFTFANWAVCTLMEGKGRLRDILCMTAYSLVPFIAFTAGWIVLSNLLTLTESTFLGLLMLAGIVWSGVLIFAGLSSIHQFSFRKTVFCVILTFVGVAVIVFLLILFFGLLKQVLDFIISIYSELNMML